MNGWEVLTVLWGALLTTVDRVTFWVSLWVGGLVRIRTHRGFPFVSRRSPWVLVLLRRDGHPRRLGRIVLAPSLLLGTCLRFSARPFRGFITLSFPKGHVRSLNRGSKTFKSFPCRVLHLPSSPRNCQPFTVYFLLKVIHNPISAMRDRGGKDNRLLGLRRTTLFLGFRLFLHVMRGEEPLELCQ